VRWLSSMAGRTSIVRDPRPERRTGGSNRAKRPRKVYCAAGT
jgi:hypothetical protein